MALTETIENQSIPQPEEFSCELARRTGDFMRPPTLEQEARMARLDRFSQRAPQPDGVVSAVIIDTFPEVAE